MSIRFEEGDDRLPEIKTLCEERFREYDNLPEELYVFGIANSRDGQERSDIYLGESFPNAQEIKDFLSNSQGFNLAVENVGADRINRSKSLGLKRSFRNRLEDCAKIALFCYLALNGKINFLVGPDEVV